MLQDARRLWEIIREADRRRFFVVMGMVLIMAFMESAGVLSLMPFLAVLGNPDLVTTHPIAIDLSKWLGIADPRKFLAVLGLFSVALVCASALFKSITLHFLSRYANLQRYHISTRLLRAYLEQPYAFHLGRNSSDLSKTMLSEIDQLVLNLLQPVMLMTAHGAVILAMVVVLVIYDTTMAIMVAGAIAMFYGAIYLVVRRVLGRIGPDRYAANAERFRACSEALGGIKEVNVTGVSSVYISRFAAAARRFSRHLATSDTVSQTPLYLVECLGYSVIIGLALFLMLRGEDIGSVLPVLGLYGFAAYRMLPAAQIVYRGAARMRFGAPALRHICEELRLTYVANLDEVEGGETPEVKLRNTIRFENVTYTYPGGGKRPSLRDINIQIEANTAVGIIGTTGSGKSTLIDLLLGLLTPDEGRILIDGVPLRRGNLASWRQSIGYVPQHIFLTDSSVAENIAFGQQRTQLDMTAVEQAARAAQLHDFIVSYLPEGYETQVGERGVRLSGGERQRLGIARALYANPSVLLLDEATSALDVSTEAAVLSAINALKASRTIILVAHRLATVEGCDKLIWLDRGEVRAHGGVQLVLEVARLAWES